MEGMLAYQESLLERQAGTLSPRLEIPSVNIEQMHLFAHLKKLCKKPRGLISFVMASGDVQLLNKLLPGSLIDWRSRHAVVLLNKRGV